MHGDNTLLLLAIEVPQDKDDGAAAHVAETAQHIPTISALCVLCTTTNKKRGKDQADAVDFSSMPSASMMARITMGPPKDGENAADDTNTTEEIPG